MKTVIGLTGEKGSGKETFTNILQLLLPDKVIIRVRFSDILGETLDLWGVPKTRENLQRLGWTMRDAFGNDVITKALKNRIENAPADIVVIDGIRYKEDADLARSFPKNILVYITSDLKTRFERLKNRAEKTGESEATFAQFMKEEKAPTEIPIPKTGKGADYKITNNETIEDFTKEVEKFIKSFKLPE